MDLSKVTVIIPVKNEEKNIITFLDNLPPYIKLIVVDSSTDRTRELINIRRPQNTEIIYEECNIAKARQTGAEAASAEWLLFSDADIIFDNAYFSNLEKITPVVNSGAIMGPKLSKDRHRWYYKIYTLSMRLFSWISIPLGSGSNMLIKKSVLQQVGGFDLQLAVSEDSDILWRIKKSGYKVIFKNSIKVFEVDHRRLDQGVFRKYRQSTLRLIFLMLGARKSLQKSDWGYWKDSE